MFSHKSKSTTLSSSLAHNLGAVEQLVKVLLYWLLLVAAAVMDRRKPLSQFAMDELVIKGHDQIGHSIERLCRP